MDSIIDSKDMSLSKLWDVVEDREPDVLQSVGPQRIGHDLTTEEQLILHWGNCASKDRWHFQRHVATK